MKYVKLVARPNTWFKEGTEVYDYDCSYEDKKRITLEQWTQWVADGMYCARGTRISESENELVPVGKEYFDGECGSLDEFEAVEIVDEPV